MATTMTLANLRTAARQRADMVNSTFVSDAELNSYINQSGYELYDLLAQKYGDAYFAKSSNITTDGTNETFALPSDFYKLLGVDLQINADQWTTVRPFSFAERNRYPFPGTATFVGYTPTRYRLHGDTVMFKPMPPSGQVYRLWYVPRWTELSGDSSTLEGVSGWTEYVIIDAAIKCLQKEESDVSVLMAQKAAIIQRIEAAAENRDEGNPQRVQDVVMGDFVWAPGGGMPGGGWGY